MTRQVTAQTLAGETHGLCDPQPGADPLYGHVSRRTGRSGGVCWAHEQPSRTGRGRARAPGTLRASEGDRGRGQDDVESGGPARGAAGEGRGQRARDRRRREQAPATWCGWGVRAREGPQLCPEGQGHNALPLEGRLGAPRARAELRVRVCGREVAVPGSSGPTVGARGRGQSVRDKQRAWLGVRPEHRPCREGAEAVGPPWTKPQLSWGQGSPQGGEGARRGQL